MEIEQEHCKDMDQESSIELMELTQNKYYLLSFVLFSFWDRILHMREPAKIRSMRKLLKYIFQNNRNDWIDVEYTQRFNLE